MGLTVSGVRSALDGLTRLREGYGDDAHWIVGVGMEYGVYLEFGTSRMPAYPFLLPAARDVMRSDFSRLESMSRSRAKPIPWLVQEIALAIERQAKINADAANERFSEERSPGTDPDHPQIQTGFLINSIEAAPAGAFSEVL